MKDESIREMHGCDNQRKWKLLCFPLKKWSIDEIYDAMKPKTLVNATVTFMWADLVAKED